MSSIGPLLGHLLIPKFNNGFPISQQFWSSIVYSTALYWWHYLYSIIITLHFVTKLVIHNALRIWASLLRLFTNISLFYFFLIPTVIIILIIVNTNTKITVPKLGYVSSFLSNDAKHTSTYIVSLLRHNRS